MNIVLYSTGCCKCRELKMFLELAGITDYTEITDQTQIIAAGFTNVPALCVDGVKMNTEEAFAWCKTYNTHEGSKHEK